MLAIGQAQYSALLYPEGTFVDDVIVHRLGEDDYLLVINAGTREKDFNWVRDNTRQFDCKVEHLSDDFTQIAIQGPKGVNLLQKLTDANLYRGEVLLGDARHGVRSEKHSDRAHRLHGRGRFRDLHSRRRSDQRAASGTRFLAAGKEFGVVPCGLGARNTLRLEAKLPLYGHEISDSDQRLGSWTRSLHARWRSPSSSGALRWRRRRRRESRRRWSGVEMVERGIARDGYKVLDESGKRDWLRHQWIASRHF